MRTLQFLSRAPTVGAQLLFVLGSMLITSSPTHANQPKIAGEPARLAALSPSGGLNFLLTVHPAVAKINQPRTVFFNQALPFCPVYNFYLDTSFMESQNLVLLRRNVGTGVVCPTVGAILVRSEFEFTPTKAGLLTVRDENSGAEITIQTVSAAVASKFDVNGMWFDVVTNGSGIALHHRRGTTDVAFGTWFLYNNNGESRWYTFQSANWQQDGSVLEGLLIQSRGGCQTSNLAGCPAVGSFRTDPPQDLFWVTPSLARITFQSSTRARAEVFSLGGAPLFTSDLTKLLF